MQAPDETAHLHRRPVGGSRRARISALDASKLTRAEIIRVEELLHCDECPVSSGHTVVSYGDRAVPALARRLDTPTPRVLENARIHARAVVDTTLTGWQNYLARMENNFKANYQKRAAAALAEIGTEKAVRELRNALANADVRSYRDDVRIAIAAALANADSTGNILAERSVVFGDTVGISRGSQLVTSVLLPKSPFASMLLLRSTADSLFFVAAADTGFHFVTARNPGTPSDSVIVPLQISALRAPPRRLAPLVPDTFFPQTHFVVFNAAAGDSAAFYRFQPNAELALFAAVDVVGNNLPSILWRSCPDGLDPAPIGSPGQVGRVVKELSGTPVTGAMVEVVGTAIATTTDGTGKFTLPSVPLIFGERSIRINVINYLPRTVKIHAGADSVGVSVTGDAAGRNQHWSSVRIPAATCRILQVSVGSATPKQIVRLRLSKL